jgi:hypothetical protein
MEPQDFIGSIDDTHLTARVLRSKGGAYRDKKHYTSQNVLDAAISV